MASTISSSTNFNEFLATFKSYGQYLDSFLTKDDMKYLSNRLMAHEIVKLGYRSNMPVLSEAEFNRRICLLKEKDKKAQRVVTLASKGMFPEDEFVRQLAIREFDNRNGMLQTIININCKTKHGRDISAYIDYAERLVSEDWRPFFSEKATLVPRSTDMGYCDWSQGITKSNTTKYFEPLYTKKGFAFKSFLDDCIVYLNPNHPPGEGTTKTKVVSKKYQYIFLFDHIPQRINQQ